YDFGARADAQESTNINGTTCSLLANAMHLTCAHAIFNPNDGGKSIEIPGAGATATAPAPTATLLTTITTVDANLQGVMLNNAGNATGVSNVVVTWGPDNSTAFQNAFNACPGPSNPSTISPFNSKGCVVVVPDPGSTGTGDYMFGSAVVLN